MQLRGQWCLIEAETCSRENLVEITAFSGIGGAKQHGFQIVFDWSCLLSYVIHSLGHP